MNGSASSSPALVTGIGAVTPLGRNAWTSAAAARAGACGFREHPYLIDTGGEPVRVAAVHLDEELQGVERLGRLLTMAIDEALQAAPDLMQIEFFVGMPPPRPGIPGTLPAVLREIVVRRYGRRVAAVHGLASGHASSLLGMKDALRAVATGAASACIVAGVDSYLDAETLEWIEQCDQLHGGGPLNNAWGFIPGEAAAAVLLEARASSRPLLAELVSVGAGMETKLIKTDTVCIAEGLTQAFREALRALGPGDIIDNVYCDLNGEAYRADEYGFTVLRTKESFRAATEFVAPADCWGDVGAASGPLHMLLAIAASMKGTAKGPLSMIWASSEGGDRAAAILRAGVARRD